MNTYLENFIPPLKWSLCSCSFVFHSIIYLCMWKSVSLLLLRAERCMMMCFEATEGGFSNSGIYFPCLKILSHVAPTAVHKIERIFTKQDSKLLNMSTNRRAQQKITVDFSVMFFSFALVWAAFVLYNLCFVTCQKYFKSACPHNEWNYYMWTVQRQHMCKWVPFKLTGRAHWELRMDVLTVLALVSRQVHFKDVPLASRLACSE